MSSKAKRTADGIQRPAQIHSAPTEPVKTAVYRIDIGIFTKEDPNVVDQRSVTVEVSGIPKELKHEEYDGLAVHTAQTTFCNVINQRAFLETYKLGETAKTCVPEFLNLFGYVNKISILQVVWLEEKDTEN